MALSVQGKTALITGAGSGICLEFCKLLLAKGCNVLAVDRALSPEAEVLYANLAKSSSSRAVFYKADVTDWKQLRGAFEAAIKEFATLDIVCPGAGLLEPTYSNFWQFDKGTDTDESSSFKLFDVNVGHPVRATQLALDSFLRQKLGHGVIIHMSSVIAQLAVMPTPMYTASKHAISGFVRSLAPLEPQMNIRVVAVAPWIVKTPLWSSQQLSWVDDTKDKWVTTQEVANTMLDLIQNPEYVGGTIVEVGPGTTRKVEQLNDPGPASEDCTMSNVADAFANTFEAIEQNFGK